MGGWVRGVCYISYLTDNVNEIDSKDDDDCGDSHVFYSQEDHT